MKEWNNPLIEELEIRTTAYVYENGKVPDSYLHDNVNGGPDQPVKYKEPGSGSTVE